MTALSEEGKQALRGGNPFFHRGAIRDPAYFYGRQRETRLLLEFVRQAQSVSVVGPRRIGKTSFLLHVAHPTVLQAHGLNSDQVVLVFIDCQGRGELSEGELCQLLLRSLARALGDRVEWRDLLGSKGPPCMATVEEAVSQTVAQGRRLVFLLDEFEDMATNRNLGGDLFSSLRRITTEYPVAYVTATKDPLLALTYADEGVLSSPFFNVFQPLRLGLFTAEESSEMLRGLAAGAGQPFPTAVVEFVLDLAGRHPLFLQLAGFQAFEMLETRQGELSAADYRLIRERFWSTAVQHFEYYWANLDDDARYALATLPLLQATVGALLEHLEQQCLIVQRRQGYDSFSSAFRDFVSRQPVTDVVQAGPFVVDLRQQAASLDGQRLDLTRTQYALLTCLLQRPGQVATYAELEEEIWGDAYTGDPERLKAAVKHLRRALGDRAGCIVNVRGMGYMVQPLADRA